MSSSDSTITTPMTRACALAADEVASLQRALERTLAEARIRTLA